MAKCDICGKGVHFGNNVSHSHRRSNAIWNSNVRSVKCKVNGAAKRMHICTRCLRSGAVERAELLDKKEALYVASFFMSLSVLSKTRSQ